MPTCQYNEEYVYQISLLSDIFIVEVFTPIIFHAINVLCTLNFHCDHLDFYIHWCHLYRTTISQ